MKRGHVVQMVTADGRPTLGLPTYPDIRLAVAGAGAVGAEIAAFVPDALHIATEGTLGLAARRICLVRGSHSPPAITHTRFPEMIRMRWPLPGLEHVVYRWFSWFHGPAKHVLVPTPSMARVLHRQGFANIVPWTRGVDHQHFRPRPKDALAGLPRPIALYAGRVAIEKSLPDFLDLDLPGSKVVVGDGPMLSELKRRYAHFTGYLEGEGLARTMAAADVFVFPSWTDTFGLVMIEALASGVPVSAYDVPGPRDIITSDEVGAIGGNLGASIQQALTRGLERCRAFALTFSWERAAEQFERHLVPIGPALSDRLERLSLAASATETPMLIKSK